MNAGVSRVLELREDPSIRPDLSRAFSISAEYKAYPYLATYYTLESKYPLLYTGALAAKYHKINDAEYISVGQFMADVAKRERVAQSTMDKKLVSTQTMSLSNFVKVIRSTMDLASTGMYSISWNSLYSTLLNWESKNRSIRLETRRKVLEDYYKHIN